MRCSLPLSNSHGQAYDGASNMAGHVTGVAKRVLDEYPKAHFVHCMAHCLNLCLQDMLQANVQVLEKHFLSWQF